MNPDIYNHCQAHDNTLLMLLFRKLLSEEEVNAALDREHQQKDSFLLFPIRQHNHVFHIKHGLLRDLHK